MLRTIFEIKSTAIRAGRDWYDNNESTYRAPRDNNYDVPQDQPARTPTGGHETGLQIVTYDIPPAKPDRDTIKGGLNIVDKQEKPADPNQPGPWLH
jgi:hypothetical protein